LGINVLAAYFAAGLVWWASLSLLISGPIGATGAIIGWRTPQQRIAFGIGVFSCALIHAAALTQPLCNAYNDDWLWIGQSKFWAP